MTASRPKEAVAEDPGVSQEVEQKVTAQNYSLRPRHSRQPEALNDYELG